MNLNLKNIEYLMFIKNINRTELAKRANISRSWLSVVLNRGNATSDLTNKLAKALDVGVEELIDLDEIKKI